jgi:hypothetical protein
VKAAPWFKFWASDYMMDRDVDELPLEAQALLVRIWCVIWLEGGIPKQPEEIARKCRVSILHVQMHLQKLMQFLYEDASGLLMSKRMEAERARSSITSKARSESAKSRWNKDVNANAYPNAHANGNANGHAKLMLSESESETDIKPKTIVQKRFKVDSEDDFLKAYKIYPRHVGKGAAKKAWGKAIGRRKSEHTASDASRFIIQRVEAYATACIKINLEKSYTPHMATWLNEDRFLDDPKEWEVRPNGKAVIPAPLSVTSNVLADAELERQLGKRKA